MDGIIKIFFLGYIFDFNYLVYDGMEWNGPYGSIACDRYMPHLHNPIIWPNISIGHQTINKQTDPVLEHRNRVI